MYCDSAYLINHSSKLIAGKLEEKNQNKKTSRGRKPTSLANKQRFSQGWCGAVINTMASLSLIRPQLVSLWAGPPSKTPRPPLEGPQRGLSRDLRAPFFPPPDSYHPRPAVPLVTRLSLRGDAKKRAWKWSWGGKTGWTKYGRYEGKNKNGKVGSRSLRK